MHLQQKLLRCWDMIVRLNKWDANAITGFLLHALACAVQKYEHETGTRLLQSKPEVTESKLCSVPPRIHWEMVSNHRENSQEYFPIYSSKSRWTPLRNKAHLSAQAEINTLQTHKVYQSLSQWSKSTLPLCPPPPSPPLSLRRKVAHKCSGMGRELQKVT